MTGAAFATVGVKLFARAKIVRVVGWDDFFIVFSMVGLRYSSEHSMLNLAGTLKILSIIASAFVHYGVKLGFGRHTAAVAAESGMERLFETAKFQMLGYRTYLALSGL
jgi:hypothetical protein